MREKLSWIVVWESMPPEEEAYKNGLCWLNGTPQYQVTDKLQEAQALLQLQRSRCPREIYTLCPVVVKEVDII